MYKYFYALEKFNHAMYTLSTGEEEIRKRLLLVFQGDLMMITPEHLPEECRKDYAWIIETITKFDKKYKSQDNFHATEEGRIEATLHRIRKRTGRKIAEKLYDVWSILNTEFYK
jgi:hypothetical protein